MNAIQKMIRDMLAPAPSLEAMLNDVEARESDFSTTVFSAEAVVSDYCKLDSAITELECHQVALERYPAESTRQQTAKVIQTCFTDFGIEHCPSMDTVGETQVTLEGLVSALKNMRNQLARLRLSVFNERDSEKTVASVRRLAESLRSRLNRSSVDSYSADLSDFGKAFVTNGRYVSKPTELVKTDLATLRQLTVGTSQWLYGQFEDINALMTAFWEDPEKGVAISEKTLALPHVHTKLPSQFRGPGHLGDNLSVELGGQNVSWNKERGSSPEHYAKQQPQITLVPGEQIVVGEKSLVLKKADLLVLVSYLDQFVELVAEAKELWIRNDASHVKAAEKSQKRVAGFISKGRLYGPDYLKPHSALEIMALVAASNVAAIQQQAFRHGLKMVKVISKFTEKALSGNE